MENIFISLEKEVFKGNVLDITYDNKSIIYNVNKYYDNFVEVDYLDGSSKDKEEIANYYDSCILFFSLNKLNGIRERQNLFKDIYNLMNPNGYLYIWDINKELYKTTSKTIIVGLPDNTITRFQVNCKNLMMNNSKAEIIKDLEEFFVLVEVVTSDEAFKIVCKRKEEIN